MRDREPPRRQRKATGVRQVQIVDAAMRIIASKGARKFTAELLGARVGVTGGAIFRHFESMEAIVDAVVDRMEAILFEDFPPEAVDPIERLGIFFQRRVQAIVANPHLSRMLLSDHVAQAGSKAQAQRIVEFKRRSRNFVFECLREAQQSGLLRGDAGPEEGTILVLGSILALVHSRTMVPEGKEVEQLSLRVWRVIESILQGRRVNAARFPGSRRLAQRHALNPVKERRLK